MWTSTTGTRVVLSSFDLLSITPFVVAATKWSFWQHKHLLGPIATGTVLYLALVLALIVGRYRWAWVLLVLLDSAACVTWVFDPRRFATAYFLWFVEGLVTFALLLSAPMRRRLRRPIALPR